MGSSIVVAQFTVKTKNLHHVKIMGFARKAGDLLIYIFDVKFSSC